MNYRKETIAIGAEKPFCILHVSDVHFSAGTTHAHNALVTQDIVETLRSDAAKPIGAVCMTGDLVSRKNTEESFADALTLMREMREIAPVLYSMGNHEFDWPAKKREAFLRELEDAGITVLDNRSVLLEGIRFTGLSLPQTIYKNEKGSYSGLAPVTPEMIAGCIGAHTQAPTVLLAHSPMGLPAYAAWGAQAVLSGHVHGGIVRLCGIGILSPERRFFPRYTKGIYREGSCTMQVSAGIGKFRINNPPEIVCVELT